MIRVEKSGDGRFNLYQKEAVFVVSIRGPLVSISEADGYRKSKVVSPGKVRELMTELNRGEISEETFWDIQHGLVPPCHGA